MATKRSTKFGLGKTITAAALLALFIVSAPIIYSAVMFSSMFDTHCGEDSQPVALARSLSQEQLADLNTRIMVLSDQYPDAQLTNFKEPFIPQDLEYIDARYISFEFGEPYAVLAKCDVSEAVMLVFREARDSSRLIELNWEAPTNKKPYNRDKQILWQATDD